MKQRDVRYAMVSRDWGLRRVRQLTWGIAGAGAVGAVALVIGFGGHVHVPKLGQPAQAPGIPATEYPTLTTYRPIGPGPICPAATAAATDAICAGLSQRLSRADEYGPRGRV